METYQAEQLDVPLSQSAEVLNKNHNTEETDASTSSKRDNRFPSPFDNQDTQMEIIMAEKKILVWLFLGLKLEMNGMNKFIIEPQKVAPVDLEMPRDYLEKRSMSPKQEGFDIHPATGAYSSQYCSMAAPLSGNLDCLPSGNPVLFAPSVQSKIFIDQVTGNIYTYDQGNKLFVSMGDMDQGTATNLQQFLKN